MKKLKKLSTLITNFSLLITNWKTFQLQKLLAIFVIVCFFVSSVCHDVAAAVAMPTAGTTQYKQIFTDFILPYSYGKITKSHFAGTDRVIINIQDLHCHPQVQKNISNIIEMFDKKYGVTNVYLEGAYGDVSTKWLTENIKNDKKKTEILNKILETGKLTGAEYYSAASDKTEIIKGLEKKEPYLDNLKRFGDLLEKQDEIQIILKGIEESTAKVKKQYYTKRQYKIEELSQEYISGSMRPEKYYRLLAKHTEKLGIDLTKYENTYTYIKLLALQKQLDYKAITSQLQALVMILKEKLPYNAYKMLLDNTKNFEQTDKLYSYIIKISRDLGLDVTSDFKELNKYFTYIELSQKINPLELLKEEERLTREINTRFSDTVAQREVVFLTHFEKYLKDYMSTKITSDDYEYYKENIETYKRLYNKYVDNKVFSLLKPYMEEVDTFYKINNDRNDYFTENIFDGIETYEIEDVKEEPKEVNKIIENMDKVTRLDVIVTGGFHSQTVTDILQNEGVSYIVITPNVQGGVKEAEKTYYEIAKEQKEINFQTLATLIFCIRYGVDFEKSLPLFIKNALEAGIDEKDILQLINSKDKEKNEENEKLVKNIKNISDETFNATYGFKITGEYNVTEKLKQTREDVNISKNSESDDIDYKDFKNLFIEIGSLLNIDLADKEISKAWQQFINGEETKISFIDKIFNIFSNKSNKDLQKLEIIPKIIKDFLDSEGVNGDIRMLFNKESNREPLIKYIEILKESWKEYDNHGEIVDFKVLGSMSNIQPIKLTIQNKNGETKEVVFKCIAKEHYDETRSDVMFHIQKAVQDEKLPISKLIETKNGNYYIDTEDYYISVNEFVTGDRLKIVEHEDIEKFGKEIAEIHNELNKNENLEKYKIEDEDKWSPAKSIEIFPSEKEIENKIKELEEENFFDLEDSSNKKVIATFFILWEGNEYSDKRITKLIRCKDFKELITNIEKNYEDNEDLNSIIHIAFLWGEKYGEEIAFRKINDLIKSKDKNFAMLVKQMVTLKGNWAGIEGLEYSFIHGDLNYENLFFNENGELTGIIDWEHSDYFLRAMELARIFADTQEPEMFNVNVMVNFLQGYQENADSKLNQDELKAIIEMTRFFLISRSFETFSDSYKEGKKGTFFANLKNLDDLYEVNVNSKNLADDFYENNVSITDENVIICRLDDTFLENGNDGLKRIMSDRVITNEKSDGQTKIIYLIDDEQNEGKIKTKLKKDGLWFEGKNKKDKYKTEIRTGEKIETTINKQRKNKKIISVFDTTIDYAELSDKEKKEYLNKSQEYQDEGIMYFGVLGNTSIQKRYEYNKEYEGYGDAVVVDLDSTLFEVLHRSGILTDGDRTEINYDEFHKALVNDRLNKEVALMILSIIKRNELIDNGIIEGKKTKIIFTTGRIEEGKNEKFKVPTQEQLSKYTCWSNDCELRMKPSYKEYTSDFIKEQLEDITKYIKVSFALDDRGFTNEWIDMYREYGIPCIMPPCSGNFISKKDEVEKSEENKEIEDASSQDEETNATPNEFNFFKEVKETVKAFIISIPKSLVLVPVTILDTIEKTVTGNEVGEVGIIFYLELFFPQYKEAIEGQKNIEQKEYYDEKGQHFIKLKDDSSAFVKINIDAYLEDYSENLEILKPLQEIETARLNSKNTENKNGEKSLQDYTDKELETLEETIIELKKELKLYKVPERYQEYSYNIEDIADYLLNVIKEEQYRRIQEKMEQDLNEIESKTIKYTVGIVTGLVLSGISVFISSGDLSILLTVNNVTNIILALFGSNIVSNLMHKRKFKINTGDGKQKYSINVSKTTNADNEYSFFDNIKRMIKPFIRSIAESVVFVPVMLSDTIEKVYTGNLNNDEYVGRAGKWFLKNFNSQYKKTINQQKNKTIGVLDDPIIFLSYLCSKKVKDITYIDEVKLNKIKGQDNLDKDYDWLNVVYAADYVVKNKNILDSNKTIVELVCERMKNSENNDKKYSLIMDSEGMYSLFSDYIKRKYGYVDSDSIKSLSLLQKIEEDIKITESIEEKLGDTKDELKDAKEILKRIDTEQNVEEAEILIKKVKELNKEVKKLKEDLKTEGLGVYKDEQLQAYREKLEYEINEGTFETSSELNESVKYLHGVLLQKEMEKGLNKVENKTISYFKKVVIGLILSGVSVFFYSGDLSVLLAENNFINVAVALFASNIVNNLRWKLQYSNQQLTDTEDGGQEIEIDTNRKEKDEDKKSPKVIQADETTSAEYSFFGSIKRMILPLFISLLESGVFIFVTFVDTVQKIYKGNLNNYEYVGTLGQMFLESELPYREAIEKQDTDKQIEESNKRIKGYEDAKFLYDLFNKQIGGITTGDIEKWNELKKRISDDSEYPYISKYIVKGVDRIFSTKTLDPSKTMYAMLYERMSYGNLQAIKELDSFLEEIEIVKDIDSNETKGLLKEILENNNGLQDYSDEELQDYRKQLENGIRGDIFDEEEKEDARDSIKVIIEEQKRRGEQLQKEMEQDLNKVENKTIVYSTILALGLLRTGIAIFLSSGDTSGLLTDFTFAKIFMALLGSNIWNNLRWKLKFSNSELISIKSTKPKTDVKKAPQNASTSFSILSSYIKKIYNKTKDKQGFGWNILNKLLSNYDVFIAPIWEEGLFGLGALGISVGLSFVFAGPVIPFIGFFLWRVIMFSLLHTVTEYNSGEVTDRKNILKNLAYRLVGSTILSIPYLISIYTGGILDAAIIATIMHGAYNGIATLINKKRKEIDESTLPLLSISTILNSLIGKRNKKTDALDDKIEKMLDVFEQTERIDNTTEIRKIIKKQSEELFSEYENLTEIQLRLLDKGSKKFKKNIFSFPDYFLEFVCLMPNCNWEEKVNVDENVQKKLVDEYIEVLPVYFMVLHIENLSDYAQQKIVDKDERIFQNIQNPTEETQIIAVQKNWENIRYIKNPSKKVKDKAVRSKGFSGYAREMEEGLATRYVGDFLPDEQQDHLILQEAVEGNVGKNFDIVKISKTKTNNDGVVDKELFSEYKRLELLNMEALKLLSDLSDSSSTEDLNRIKNVLFEMIDILGEFSKDLDIKETKKFVNVFFENISDVSEQKNLHGYGLSIFDKDSLPKNVTINDLINVVHQGTIRNLLLKLKNSRSAEEGFYYNFSEENDYINPEIREILQNMFFLEEISFFKTTSKYDANPDINVFFDEKTVLMNLELGMHSATVIINLDNKNRGIFLNFWDNGENRIEPMSECLKKQGFKVLPAKGELLSAKMDATTGLTEETDIQSVLKYLMFMFVDTSDINILFRNGKNEDKIISGFEEKHSKGLYYRGRYYKLGNEYVKIDDKYDLPIMTREDYDFTIFNRMIREGQYPYTKERVNKILEDLELQSLPEDEDIYYTEPETGIVVVGQVGLDKYFNELIRRAFAEGRIIFNKEGNLIKNENYNYVVGLESMLTTIKSGEETELLTQATIIDELNKQNSQTLKLKTEAKVGKLEYQTGYLQLNNGEYLFVKVFKNPINGNIRYASVETILSDGHRGAITAKELADKVTREGYRVKTEVRQKSEGERKNFLDELKNNSEVEEISNISIPGKLMSGQRSVVGKVTFDPKNVKKGKSILLKEYLEPDDMEGTINANGIVLASGVEVSHQGLIVKEKGITATIIKDVKFFKGEKYAKIRYVTYGEPEKLEGLQDFTIQKIQKEEEITIKEGDYVEIDGETGRLILLNEEEYEKKKEEYKIFEEEQKSDSYVDTNISADIRSYNEIKKSIKQYTSGKISDNIKSFSEILEENTKKYFGTKATNLQNMFHEIIRICKDNNIQDVEVPNGIMIGAGAFLKILQKKEGFNKLYIEYIQAVETGDFDTAKEIAKKILNIIENLEDEDLEELKDIMGEYIDTSKYYAVRSAFIGEDGEKFSSAGVGESVVGVKGEEVVDKLINVVLKSAFSERSVAYQCSNRQVFTPAALVQEAVDSKKSAVMMVKDNKIIISGSWGQGEIVVSGEKTQSSIHVDVNNNVEIEITDYVTERQDYKYGFNGVVKEVSDEDSTAEIFTEDEIIKMSEVGFTLRNKFNVETNGAYKSGADIELAIDEKGVINIVQIRPLTEKQESENESSKHVLQTKSTVSTLDRIEEDTFFGKAVVKLSKSKHFRYTIPGVIIGSILELGDIFKIIIEYIKAQEKGKNEKEKFIEGEHNYEGKTAQKAYANLTKILQQTQIGIALTAIATISVGITLPFVSPFLLLAIPVIGVISSLIIPHAKVNREEIKKTVESGKDEIEAIVLQEDTPSLIEEQEFNYDKQIKYNDLIEFLEKEGFMSNSLRSNLMKEDNIEGKLKIIKNKLKNINAKKDEDKERLEKIFKKVMDDLDLDYDFYEIFYKGNEFDSILFNGTQNAKEIFIDLLVYGNTLENNIDFNDKDLKEYFKNISVKNLIMPQYQENNADVKAYETIYYLKELSKYVKTDENLIKAIKNIFNGNDLEESHTIVGNYIGNDKNREKQIKAISKIYAYHTWKKFINNKNNRDKLDDLRERGINISLKNWIHVCDAHSPFMVYNEIGEPNNNWKKVIESDYEDIVYSFATLEDVIMICDLILENNLNKDTYKEKLYEFAERGYNIVKDKNGQYEINYKGSNKIYFIQLNELEGNKFELETFFTTTFNIKDVMGQGTKLPMFSEIQSTIKVSIDSLKNMTNPMKPVNAISEYFARDTIMSQMNKKEIAFIKKENENNIAEKSDKVRYYSIGENARNLVHTKVGVIYVKDGKVVDENEEGAETVQVRLAVNKNNEYIFYSNTMNIKNIDNIDTVIEELMDKFRNEGVKTNLFNDNTIFAFPNTDKKVLTETDIENSINNKQTSYVMPAETIKYTFEDDEDINERICKGIKDKTGITTFVVSEQQYEKVKQLDAKGYSFIVKETDIDTAFENIEENQGSVFIDLSSQKYNKETAEEKLKQIRNKKLATKQGVNLAVTVKFRKDTYEEMVDINIFEEYGIIPIVEAKNKDIVEGKKEIDNITDIKELENKADIIGYIFNGKNIEAIEKESEEVGGIKTIIENIRSSMKDNPQKQYNKGHEAALKNNGYQLNDSKDITSNVIDLKELLQMNSKDIEELQGEESIIKIIKENLSLFNPQAQSYINEELLAKGKYIEAIGFILGVVENSVAEEVVKEFELGNGKDFIKEIGSNENQAILMIIIGQMIKGKTLKDIIEEDKYEKDYNYTVKIEDIKNELNSKLDKVLRTGIPETAEGFDGIKAILTDRYGADTTVEKAEVAATLAIRSMLAAA